MRGVRCLTPLKRAKYNYEWRLLKIVINCPELPLYSIKKRRLEDQGKN
jgi:hypothetical protein